MEAGSFRLEVGSSRLEAGDCKLVARTCRLKLKAGGFPAFCLGRRVLRFLVRAGG